MVGYLGANSMDDRIEFKIIRGDTDITHRIYDTSMPFDELLKKFKEFALACGYLPETIDNYTRWG